MKKETLIPLEGIPTEELVLKQKELLTNADLICTKRPKEEVQLSSNRTIYQPALQSIPWMGIRVGTGKH